MPYITDLEIDAEDGNRFHIERHGITADEVFQVLDNSLYVIIRNRNEHRAPYVMIGPTYGGRLLTIPIAPTDLDGVWRPSTAWDAKRGERTVYDNSRRRP